MVDTPVDKRSASPDPDSAPTRGRNPGMDGSTMPLWKSVERWPFVGRFLSRRRSGSVRTPAYDAATTELNPPQDWYEEWASQSPYMKRRIAEIENTMRNGAPVRGEPRPLSEAFKGRHDSAGRGNSRRSG